MSDIQPVSSQELLERAKAIHEKIRAWRREIHRYPELTFTEQRTSGLVNATLIDLGIETETEVAKTGVVGHIRGGVGPTVGLRADMDALPITEEVDLPFRSTVKSTYRGEPVGVMHACGHDAHTAILMGLAEALVAVRTRLPGSVVLLFQPAEEGAPEGEEGGAALMLKEGVFEKYKPDFVMAQGDTTTTFIASLAAFYRRIPFGHIEAGLRTGDIQNPFPEEFNRTASALITKHHFAPTSVSAENLFRAIDAFVMAFAPRARPGANARAAVIPRTGS